jgi:hypothetical protein
LSIIATNPATTQTRATRTCNATIDRKIGEVDGISMPSITVEPSDTTATDV